MKDKPKLIVSACLFGHPVRYDATSKPISLAHLQKLEHQFQLIPLCPELLGGLPVPRPAAEIRGGTGMEVLSGAATVCTCDGADITDHFVDGAKVVLANALAQDVEYAILKSNSPSCGVHQHFDGTFCGKLRDGAGVTAALLQKHGIQVFSEDEIDSVYQAPQTK